MISRGFGHTGTHRKFLWSLAGSLIRNSYYQKGTHQKGTLVLSKGTLILSKRNSSKRNTRIIKRNTHIIKKELIKKELINRNTHINIGGLEETLLKGNLSTEPTCEQHGFPLFHRKPYRLLP